jgi:ferric-dicitrate binding protein FerR (iron transport regulator)
VSDDTVEPLKKDEALERALEDELRRTPLSDGAYARIYAAVEAEWRSMVRSRAARRTWGAVAAGLAVLVLLAVIGRSMPEAPVIASVGRVEGGTLQARSLFSWHRSLGVGAVLHRGDTVIARGSALLDLHGGGSVRVASGTELEVVTADQITLREGEIYVDIPPNLTGRATFAVRTPVGLIEHLGTQFDVAWVDRSIRVRVREGRVRVLRGSETQTAAAGTELWVPKEGAVRYQEIPAQGPEWAWTAAVTPEYDIEDQKLVDFLHWTARETGRQLSWVDDRARQVAERTQLHGSVRGLPVDEALDRVLASTSLRLDLRSDVIRVSSGE